MPVMAQNKPLLVLFDGNALIHRAFHALPPLAVTRTGEPTGAVSGFATMVLKVLSELKPTHCAVAFDHPAPTFRHKEFAEYKAHRPPAPDDLISQFKRVHQLVDAFNIASFEAEGYEADDILGTLARQASQEGIETIIVTGDMDTLQLVEPRVKVMTPRPGKPFSDTVLYDEGKVEERYGLTPRQIADLKGLKGDPSDNIPGVPGVGEKTAVKLLQQYQTVDGIYQHIDEVQPAKAHNALAENEEAARQSKRLATIVTDVPIELDLPNCAVGEFDRGKVVELFRELEFNRLLGRLDELGGTGGGEEAVKVEKVETDYRTVDTEQALDELIETLRSAASFAFDTETTSLNPMYARLVGLSFSHAAGKAFYVPVGHRLGEQMPLNIVLEKLQPIFNDPRFKKSAHNGKYDMAVLATAGVDFQGLAFDTMIAAHLMGEKSIGLKALAFNRLGVEMTPIASLIGSGAKQVTMDYVPVPEVSRYACADADMTFRLACMLEEELKGQGLWDLFHDVEMPLVPVLLQMERNGVALDTQALWAMSEGMGRRMAELEADIYNSVGHQFNINSSQQLSAVLFEELRLPGGRKTKSGYSTDASVLEGLRELHPVIAPLLEYRQITKLKSTYVAGQPRDRQDTHQLQPDRYRHRAAVLQRPQPAEHPGAGGNGARSTKSLRRRRRLHAAERGLLADRPAGDGPPVAGREAAGRLLARRRHPPRHRIRVLRRAPRRGDAGHEAFGQGGQLRRAVRHERLRAGAGHRALPRGGNQVHQDIFREVPRGAAVHRGDQTAGEGAGLRRDAARQEEVHPRHQRLQRPGEGGGGAHGDQHAGAGHRRRYHQAGDDQDTRRDAEAGAEVQDDPPGARRAGVRGAARGERRDDATGAGCHACRPRAERATDRRGQGRRQLGRHGVNALDINNADVRPP